MPGRGFIIFWIFLLFFFWNFLARVEYERNFGVKFCFHFFGLSHFSLKIMFGIGFIIFWIFLLFFSEFSCPGRVWMELGTKIFFFSFLAYLIQLWLKIMPGRDFIIFLIFFSEFSCPGRVWTEFWSKILFSLFRPFSSRFGKK